MNGSSKLALGTVQFGLDYGVSNTTGKVSSHAIASILELCHRNGIDTLDTAQGYGDSQRVLGSFDLSSFKITSKMSKGGRVEQSLEELGVNQLEAMLLHREDDFDDEVYEQLKDAKSQNLINKLGLSVYTPERLLELIECYDIDIVQLPLNLLDQRFLALLPELRARSIEVHTRSAFLQGLLLMAPQKRPEHFKPYEEALNSIPEPRLQSCLSFLHAIAEIDRIVVGVTTPNEFKEIIQAYNHPTIIDTPSQFAQSEVQLINPVFWPQAR